jgi:hypothetical protein
MGRSRSRFVFELIIKGNEFLIRLISEQLTTKYYLADQLFDDEQREDLPVVIVWFNICNGITDEVIKSIALSGFSWMGDRYFYLTTKDPGLKKTFFCRQIDPTITNSLSLWNRIASFHYLKSLPMIGMRLGLLVSGSYPGLTIHDPSSAGGIKITLLPDLLNHTVISSSPLLCTEGSGFISSELALENHFPLHVIQGNAIQPLLSSAGWEEKQDSQSTLTLALAYQIRLICSYGLFKGTLIVDPYLEGRQLILRESMRKALPPPPPPPLSVDHPPLNQHTPPLLLSIVNTPPIYHCLHSSNCLLTRRNSLISHDFTLLSDSDSVDEPLDPVRRCCGCPLPAGNLNRHLILILHQSCCLPFTLFEELVR